MAIHFTWRSLQVTPREAVQLMSGMQALGRCCVFANSPLLLLTVPLKIKVTFHQNCLWNEQSLFPPALEVACPGMDPKLFRLFQRQLLKSMN